MEVSATTINSGDMAGVTLAAIKELSTENEALKEQISGQQTQIETLQQQVSGHQKQIDALKALVCSQNPTAEVCRPKE